MNYGQVGQECFPVVCVASETDGWRRVYFRANRPLGRILSWLLPELERHVQFHDMLYKVFRDILYSFWL